MPLDRAWSPLPTIALKPVGHGAIRSGLRLDRPLAIRLCDDLVAVSAHESNGDLERFERADEVNIEGASPIAAIARTHRLDQPTFGSLAVSDYTNSC